MAKKKVRYRFLNYSNAAAELDTDAGVISRKIGSGNLTGGEMQVFVQAKDDTGQDKFYEVGGSTIKVVDMDAIEIEKKQVVKFRKKQ